MNATERKRAELAAEDRRFVQFSHWGDSELADQLKWAEANSPNMAPELREVYRAGFSQGWVKAYRLLKTHNQLTVAE